MIENLKIFHVPYVLEDDRPGITFYKSEECNHRDSDWLMQWNESDDMVPTRMPNYYPPKIRKLMHKLGVDI